jgi:hypothetical protein
MFSDIDSSNINADTLQGITFLDYKKEYAKASGNTHSLLSVSSSPQLGSIIEALDGSDSLSSYQDAIQQSLSTNQAAFDSLLSQYTTAYANYIKDINTTSYYSTTDSSNNSVSELKLLDLNRELVNLAQKISTEIGQLQVTDSSLREIIEYQQAKIYDYISELEYQQETISITDEEDYNDMDSVDGQIETTELHVNSVYYHYIVYFFISITLIVFIFNIYSNPEADTMKAVFLLVALLGVYVISRWVN